MLIANSLYNNNNNNNNNNNVIHEAYNKNHEVSEIEKKNGLSHAIC